MITLRALELSNMEFSDIMDGLIKDILCYALDNNLTVLDSLDEYDTDLGKDVQDAVIEASEYIIPTLLSSRTMDVLQLRNWKRMNSGLTIGE